MQYKLIFQQRSTKSITLLKQYNFYGFSNEILLFFSSYLFQNYQFVRYCGRVKFNSFKQGSGVLRLGSFVIKFIHTRYNCIF